MKKLLGILVLGLLLSGCMIESGQIESKVLIKNKLEGKKEIVFLNKTTFETDLTIELTNHGFSV